MTVDPPAPEPMEQRAERLAADLAAAVRRAEDAERIANNRARELTDARIAADRAEAERDAATAALAQARRETWARAAEIAERVAIPEDCHGVEAHGRLMAAHAAADAIRSAAAGEEKT